MYMGYYCDLIFFFPYKRPHYISHTSNKQNKIQLSLAMLCPNEPKKIKYRHFEACQRLQVEELLEYGMRYVCMYYTCGVVSQDTVVGTDLPVACMQDVHG